MAKKTNDEDGVWRTIKGRHIFIKNGQSLEEAMAESGKFEGKTKTDVKKDNNKVKDEEPKKEDKEDKKDKDKDKAKEEPTNDLKSQVDELLGKSHTKIPNDVLGSVDDIYDDYLADQKGDKFYAIEGDKILTFDTDVNGSEKYWEEEFPISDYEDANKWLNGEVEYSDYLESKKDSQDSQPKTESNASGDVTSDDLDDYVNFKIEGPDGKPQYVSASWSYNDLDEEDIPDGESLEDWRGINYNIYDENGEEVDGGMLITDQDSFKAEDLCKDLIELNGYSRDNKIERLDNGDIEDVMQPSDSGKSTEDPYDDPESEESQRLQSIQSRYDDYLQKTEGRGASYGEIAHVDSLRGKDLDDFEKELDDFEAEEESKNNDDNNLHALYAQYLHDKQGKSWEDITSLEENTKEFNKSMREWNNTKDKQDYEREYDNEAINRYNDRIKELQKELKGNINDNERKDKQEQLDHLTNSVKELQAKHKSTNETMNDAIRQKAGKKATNDELKQNLYRWTDDEGKRIQPSDDFVKVHDKNYVKQNEDGSSTYIATAKDEDGNVKYYKQEYEKGGTPLHMLQEYDSLEEAMGKSTNETMNNAIRQKANKTKQVEPDLPKATEIKTQGKSNRKEVSENIQAHILDYYDSPEDFVEQMDVFNYLPNNWKRGEEIAKGGSYLIYNGDMADFLDSLKINPKGKKFSEDKAFDMYTSLIGRESAKLYDRIKKNQYNQYKKDHPLTKMTFEDFKNQKKK